MLKRHRKINASLTAFRRMTTSKEVTVLGAGAIGVCVALYLQRDGLTVTLIDRDKPASGYSFGNAGLIQCTSVVQIAAPGILRQVPRMRLDKSQPLFIQWRYLPSLSPYLLRFLGEARDNRVAANAWTLASIVPDSYKAYRPLIAAAGVEEMAAAPQLEPIQTSRRHTFRRVAVVLRNAVHVPIF